MSEVKFNKNGYEIRADILDMAKNFVTEEFRAKYQAWELTVDRDPATGQVIAKVAMPQFPGLEEILKTAERMYNFVNQSTHK